MLASSMTQCLGAGRSWLPQVCVFYELSLAAAMAGCFYLLINVVVFFFFDRILLACCLSVSGADSLGQEHVV